MAFYFTLDVIEKEYELCFNITFGIVSAVTKVKRKVVKLLKSKSCY